MTYESKESSEDNNVVAIGEEKTNQVNEEAPCSGTITEMCLNTAEGALPTTCVDPAVQVFLNKDEKGNKPDPPHTNPLPNDVIEDGGIVVPSPLVGGPFASSNEVFFVDPLSARIQNDEMIEVEEDSSEDEEEYVEEEKYEQEEMFNDLPDVINTKIQTNILDSDVPLTEEDLEAFLNDEPMVEPPSAFSDSSYHSMNYKAPSSSSMINHLGILKVNVARGLPQAPAKGKPMREWKIQPPPL